MHARRSTAPVTALVVVACIVLFGLFLAPPQLGGSTIYSSTVGNSMEPLFHKGDLALVKPVSTYKVGDIVLYMSPVFHRPVLHRIIVVQHGHYFFKGDNNHFVDPGYATRAELLGRLWYRVPRAGRVLTWFGKPSHAAMLAAASMLALLLGGSKKVRRRRRGRRRRPADNWRPAAMNTDLRRHMHRPRKSGENIFGFAAFALAIVLVTVGFTTPLKKTVQLADAYQHRGQFTYSGRTVRPDAAYPDGTVHAGEPIFLHSFKDVTVGFAYRFASRFPHGIRGTIALRARISSDSISWRNLYTLQKAKPFSGDRARVGSVVQLQQLQQLIGQLAVDSGAAGSEYQVELQPVIHYRGIVHGHRIFGTYTPVLPFTVTDTLLKVAPVAAATPVGATYSTPSAGDATTAALSPVQGGSVPVPDPNLASFARYSLPISSVRGLGLALLALAFLVPLTKPLRGRTREVWSLEKRIANRFGCVIVDVVGFSGVATASARTTRVASFESLATLARYCERPILHATIDGVEGYGVEDGGGLYVYRVSEQRHPADAKAIVPPPPPEAKQDRPKRRIRPAAIFFALVVAGTLVTGFTAANTVPVSYASASNEPKQISQETPSQCAGLALTTLLVASGATTSGTNASELILGKSGSGTLTLNGGGGDDCIVGGGGSGTTNKFDGGTGTNICIGAPGATNSFKNCAKTY